MLFDINIVLHFKTRTARADSKYCGTGLHFRVFGEKFRLRIYG
jgi:hypothetical protein